ncbi:MAG: hypothetical protein ACI86H_000283 [bacterium]
MILRDFIESNYKTACAMQHEIVRDSKMKLMLSSRSINKPLVMSWMLDYGLFQGIKATDREAIIQKYYTLVFHESFVSKTLNTDQIKIIFYQFLLGFYETVPRKWLSATSKLLWCSFPDKVVIYDAFVERALVVLQGITPYLINMPRIKTSPTIKSISDIDSAITFYMNYQSMVLAILSEHQSQLETLRTTYNESYPHDIRIIDKLLWMLGNPNQPFELNGNICDT